MVARFMCCIAALVCVQCGYVGLDLLPIEGQDGPTESGVPDAGVEDARAQEAGTHDDASSLPDLDASKLSDASDANDGDGDGKVMEASTDVTPVVDAAPEDATLGVSATDADIEDAGDATFDAAPARCDLSGDWVAKLELATSWPGGSLSAGSGTTTLWLRYQASASGGLVGNSLVQCGLTLPTYTSTPALGSESYQPSIADALFDAIPARVLASNVNVGLSGIGAPGDTVNITQTAFVLGTTLSDPVNAAWPANSALVDNDQDMDGLPGVTVQFASGSAPPVDGSARADQGYVASRLALGGSVGIVACNELDGPITVTHFDTHFVGCHVEGGAACTSAQRDALDTARPVYSVSSATMHALKVGTATCAIARSTLP